MALLLAIALTSAVCLCQTAYASLLFHQVSRRALLTLLSPHFSVDWATVRSMQGVGRDGRSSYPGGRSLFAPSSPSSFLKVWSCGRTEWEFRLVPPPTNQFTLGFQRFTKPQRWFSSKSHSGRREVKTHLMEIQSHLGIPTLAAEFALRPQNVPHSLCPGEPGPPGSIGQEERASL